MTERIGTTLLPRPIAHTGLRPPWTPAARVRPLAPHTVHVWRADLRNVEERVVELLSRDERVRAERVLGEREAQLWMRSRGVLRTLLGRYLGVPGKELRFGTGAHGKPALLDARGSAALKAVSFNISHSRHLAVYAFAAGGPVGVDVQLARDESRRALDVSAVAARALGDEAAERLRGIADADHRKDEFLRMWTRHEARLKWRGTGIGRPAPDGEDEPWIAELEIGARAACAIALRAEPRELHCWQYA